METTHAKVISRLLSKASRLFTGTLGGRIIEILQNARRAKARHVVLVTRDGKVLFEKRAMRAQRDAYTDQGQLQAEYQTLPLLAETLAQNVTHAVLDVW